MDDEIDAYVQLWAEKYGFNEAKKAYSKKNRMTAENCDGDDNCADMYYIGCESAGFEKSEFCFMRNFFLKYSK